MSSPLATHPRITSLLTWRCGAGTTVFSEKVLPLLNCSLGVEPFSVSQAVKFRLIERPAEHTKPNNNSISQVYAYVISLMTGLVRQHGEPAVFVGDPALQVPVRSGTTGEQVDKVENLTAAVTALLEVIEQGAGLDTNIYAGPLGGSIAHYARFEEIYHGRLYGPNDTALTGPTGPVQV